MESVTSIPIRTDLLRLQLIPQPQDVQSPSQSRPLELRYQCRGPFYAPGAYQQHRSKVKEKEDEREGSGDSDEEVECPTTDGEKVGSERLDPHTGSAASWHSGRYVMCSDVLDTE